MSDDVGEMVDSLIIAACPPGTEAVPSDFGQHTRLGELGLDSLRLVEIIFELETYFCIEADEESLAELETVGDIVIMVENALEMNPG